MQLTVTLSARAANSLLNILRQPRTQTKEGDQNAARIPRPRQRAIARFAEAVYRADSARFLENMEKIRDTVMEKYQQLVIEKQGITQEQLNALQAQNQAEATLLMGQYERKQGDANLSISLDEADFAMVKEDFEAREWPPLPAETERIMLEIERAMSGAQRADAPPKA